MAATGGATLGTTLSDVDADGRFGDCRVLPDLSDADIGTTTNRAGEFGRDAAGRFTAIAGI